MWKIEHYLLQLQYKSNKLSLSYAVHLNVEDDAQSNMTNAKQGMIVGKRTANKRITFRFKHEK